MLFYFYHSILNMVHSYFFDFSALSVGQHWYWKIFGCQVHGQVLTTTAFVIVVVCLFSLISTKEINEIPDGLQNVAEFITEFIEDLQRHKSETMIIRIGLLSWVQSFYLFLFRIGLGPCYPGILSKFPMVNWQHPLMILIQRFL